MFNFNVNLSGIIELLSRNLYSSPNVYLRELLQNSVDAIRARQSKSEGFKPFISIEIYDAEPFILKDGQTYISDEMTSLIIEDNGIGLTEDELHDYLSTIGRSSKSKNETAEHHNLLGQFGIGFLSAFIVCDEIVLYTKSIKTNEVIEWRGNSDGKYSVQKSDKEMNIGTKIFLKSKVGMEHFLATENVQKLIKSYGDFLPIPISIIHNGAEEQVNQIHAPWEEENPAILKDLGKHVFHTTFFDAFQIKDTSLGIEGIIYILSYSPKMNEIRSNSKIYLKRMYLSESKAQLFPDWAFFSKGIFNVEYLEPTASREDFIDSDKLQETKEFIASSLIEYLKNLSQKDHHKFQHLIDLHALSLKALAIKEQDIYRLFINLFEFETNQGYMTIPKFIKTFGKLTYTNTVDEFRQLAAIASAQKIGLMNGGYVYDRDLLSQYFIKNENIEIEVLEPSSISSRFNDISADDEDRSDLLLSMAAEILEPFKCKPVMKKFQPSDVMAIYNISEDQLFRRSLNDITESTKDENMASILGGLFNQQTQFEDYSVLCFNFSNALIQNLIDVTDHKLMKSTIEIIYTQSLLMARRPMNSEELQLMNQGILSLLNRAL